MKQLIVALPLLTGAALLVPAPAVAQVSIGIGIGGPGVSIGVHFPVYPRLVRVPGYPVYYAPALDANYFFFDGYFWLYLDDAWYVSSWYDGPWSLVQPYGVPYFLLRVPVRYYRAPPPHFRAWPREAPPRWGEYWGPGWERDHPDWDRWNPRTAPPPAPLPHYQRSFSGQHYPRPEAQPRIQDQHYRYQPRDPVVRQPASPPPPQGRAPRQDNRPETRREPEPRPAPQFQRPPPPPRQERPQEPPAMNRQPPPQGGPGGQAPPPRQIQQMQQMPPPGAEPHRVPPGQDRGRSPPRPEDDGRPDRGRP